MRISSLLTTTIVTSLLIGNAAHAGFFGKSDSKDEMNQAIHDYILEHPDVIMESLKKAQQKMMEQEQAKMQQAVKDNIGALESSEYAPIAGNKDGKFVIVQFFDYRCGHCKHSGPELTKFLADHPDAKIVYRNLGILGTDSTLAAQTSLAVNKLYPSSFIEFHRDLLALPEVSKKTIDDLLAKYKMDKAAIEKEIKSPELNKALEENKNLAMKIGVRGVPAYVINGELAAGAINYESLKDKYQKTQEQAKPEEKKSE